MNFQNRLEQLKNEAMSELMGIGVPILPSNIHFAINKRYTRKLANCQELPEGPYLIQVSSVVLKGDDHFAKNIIIHELLHTLPGCLNHGPEWKRWAEKVNRELGYDIQRIVPIDKIIAAVEGDPRAVGFKYKIECQGCGGTHYRSRATVFVTHPERYYCSGCGGRYKVSKLD